MDKREGQRAWIAVRIDLLLHRANELSAATAADLTKAQDGIKAEVHEVKAKHAATTQEDRAAAK
jgi:hypothetical protein